MGRVQRYGPGLVQILPEKDLPRGAVQVGHFDAVRLRVSPVELAAEPVAG